MQQLKTHSLRESAAKFKLTSWVGVASSVHLKPNAQVKPPPISNPPK